MLGSLFIVAGALILNNWYEVDLDTNMARTQKRPTVTGNISMNVILTLGVVASALGIIFMFLVNVEAATYAFLGDRKSTRLNSSHVAISYAVFCLKKKNNQLR